MLSSDCIPWVLNILYFGRFGMTTYQDIWRWFEFEGRCNYGYWVASKVSVENWVNVVTNIENHLVPYCNYSLLTISIGLCTVLHRRSISTHQFTLSSTSSAQLWGQVQLQPSGMHVLYWPLRYDRGIFDMQLWHLKFLAVQCSLLSWWMNIS
jgi:hypothetical protein